MLTRWLKLLMVIQGGRPHTAQELAERMEVSTRTIFRDVVHLQNAGMPIFYDQQGRTYRLTENFHVPPLQFKSDEVVALVMALNFARRSGPARSRKTIEALVDKLLAALPLGQRTSAGNLDRAMVIDPVPSRSVEDEQVVNILEQAAGARRKVAIRYAAFSHAGQESERTVQPYGLAYRGTALYMIGHCEMRKSLRTFRAGRIRSIRLTADTFTLPADFDLNRYLLEIWGITDGPEMAVRLRFLPQVAQLARETRWHHSQQVEIEPDGSALVSFTTRGRDELARWIAGYGRDVVVHESAELRDAVIRIGQGIRELYPPEIG